jgi:oxygen-independent coproporphyrinogen-3 oxidase
MLRELEGRKNYFDTFKKTSPELQRATLYVGGGTPSLLPPEVLNELAKKAMQVFGIAVPEEFTVELNPDDVTPDYLAQLRGMGVDRISIGVQSFFDDDLRRMNRRHSAGQAARSVQLAQQAGFGNISIDLIYGLPEMSTERWKSNLEASFSLGVQHLSAYALTVEHRTPFGVLQRKNRLPLPSDGEVAAQYALLCELSARSGFAHYEISSFARSGFTSKHNSAYWQQQPYVGIGPSAHSYSGLQRQHNPASNALYLKGMSAGSGCAEVETLSEADRYNEYIFTGLRTAWGVELGYLRQAFGEELVAHCLANAARHVAAQRLVQAGGRLTIPEHHWFISDSIIVDLIWA